MPGVPSNKACERCKKRHMKCDETRPACQRCTTAGVECPGYVQTRKFIDQGATVRRRYAPYQERHAESGPSTSVTGSRIEDQSTMSQHEQIINLDQESNESALQMQPDARLDASGDFERTEGLLTQGRPAMATHNQYSLPLSEMPRAQTMPEFDHLSGIESSGSQPGNDVRFSVPPNTNKAVSPAPQTAFTLHDRPDSGGPVSSGSPSQRSEKDKFQDIFTELMTGSEHENAFLSRHYAEVIGPWLDLSDAGKFFSVYVPIRAINCQSLRYAIAALAAKQLGRVNGTKSTATRGIFTSPATTETYSNAAQVDWFLKAANYYYLAASDLNTSTTDGYTVVSSSAVLEPPVEMVNRWLRSRVVQGMVQKSNDGSLLRRAEEVLATTVVLSLYKLMDLNGEEWHGQLSGIRALFDSLLRMHQADASSFSHGIRASFWNFARQDYLGSYFTRSPTHLDPTNLPLWRAAGISINDQEKFHLVSSGAFTLSQEDQSANGLIWLVSKVINFLAQSKQSQIAQWTGSPATNTSLSQNPMSGSRGQRYLDTNTWLDLCFEFQTWFEGVPETFRPCVRIEHPRDSSKPQGEAPSPYAEVFYTSPTCAAAMQHYHFGRIALLLNRPSDTVSAPSTAFDRLHDYREVTKEVEYRCREVSAIALGRPQGEVRIHMIPLLFAVGQCLESVDEHQTIVGLLRGVEADLGWATEYAVQKLQASWSR